MWLMRVVAENINIDWEERKEDFESEFTDSMIFKYNG